MCLVLGLRVGISDKLPDEAAAAAAAGGPWATPWVARTQWISNLYQKQRLEVGELDKGGLRYKLQIIRELSTWGGRVAELVRA